MNRASPRSFGGRHIVKEKPRDEVENSLHPEVVAPNDKNDLNNPDQSDQANVLSQTSSGETSFNTDAKETEMNLEEPLVETKIKVYNHIFKPWSILHHLLIFEYRRICILNELKDMVSNLLFLSLFFL